MTQTHKSQTFATGAKAIDSYGSLSVEVPNNGHPSQVRSDALIFARSVWGPLAALNGPHRGDGGSGVDVNGVRRPLRRFSVVIVGNHKEYMEALDRFTPNN